MRDELDWMLRPAGGGLHTVSTGRSEQQELQRAYYQATTAGEVDARWREDLAGAARARVAILGIPSDCGAGLVRGTAYGPMALREAWLAERPGLRAWLGGTGVVDLGDVVTVPQFLTDDMLSDDQIERSRRALYGGLSPEVRAGMPVAPLTIAERVLGLLFAANPALRLLVLGGDHSVAWPVARALAHRGAEPWGIVQLDAHTDLLSERLGVKICFATWAYHANDLVGRGGRLVQLGVRASGHDRSYWEDALAVRQLRPDELSGRSPEDVANEVAAHLGDRGVRRVYLSNDIDGTDGGVAPATGAPERDGLAPEWVGGFIAALGRVLAVVAADLVEVAPHVGSVEGARRTCAIGADYLRASLTALLEPGAGP